MNASAVLSLLSMAALLCSCSITREVTATTADGFRSAGQGLNKGFSAVAGAVKSPFQPNVPIVQARPDSFRKTTTGHEQMLAYQQKVNQRNAWMYATPIDFNEPALPLDNDTVDGTALLLPPKQP